MASLPIYQVQFEGKMHDSTLFYETGMLPNLRRIAFYKHQPLRLYGDTAYRLGVHLQLSTFKDRQLTPQMRLYNWAMK